MILERLGADFALCRRVEDPRGVPRPRDLLITTGRRAQALAEPAAAAKGEPAPIWLCVHGQDFEALRSRLRELGVHYLVNSAVDQESLRLLIEMLLHDRSERRVDARLPVGVEVTLRARQAGRVREAPRPVADRRSPAHGALSRGRRSGRRSSCPLELRGGGARRALAGRVARVELGAGRRGVDGLLGRASSSIRSRRKRPRAAGGDPVRRASGDPDLGACELRASGERRRAERRAYRGASRRCCLRRRHAARRARPRPVGRRASASRGSPGSKKGMPDRARPVRRRRRRAAHARSRGRRRSRSARAGAGVPRCQRRRSAARSRSWSPRCLCSSRSGRRRIGGALSRALAA